MTKEEKGAKAFELHNGIRENEIMRRALFAQNAQLLNQMQETKLYREFLGDPEAEWNAYLSETEIYYSRNQVYEMIRIVKKFTEELGETNYWDVPRSRLIELLPIVNKENVEEWIEKARVLIPSDWKIEVRQAKGLVTEDECSHDYQTYEICKVCGQKHQLSVN
jgi:hypothetical protein